jgi:hydroxyethylthiazole kinase
MLLSPPFLPEPVPGETEDQFLARALLPGMAGSGGFPLSYDLNWHGGVHLTAPMDSSGNPLPVRAIADGTVVFTRPATARIADPNHPLNYGKGWTDKGCVVIRHKTAIGAATTPPPAVVREVTYFSIYMHLGTVAPTVVAGTPIYRKDLIGEPGSIYGTPNLVHLEIGCDDDNVEALTGRRAPFFPATTHGRADVIYGTLFFLVPAGVEVFASDPRRAAAPPPVVYRTAGLGLIITKRSETTDVVLSTFDIDGNAVGARMVSGSVHDLFARAAADFPSSPRAGFEILRYGRVIGPDPLNPPAAPAWEQVSCPGGSGWINLNGPTVRHFSDGDFPDFGRRTGTLNGWRLVDGTPVVDSRCKEIPVLDVLDIDQDSNVPLSEAHTALNTPAVQEKLSHRICKIETEWDPDPAALERRYKWLRDPPVRMNEANILRRKAHIATQCFWSGAIGLPAVHWHFHPVAFIKHLRQCLWLSDTELAQCFPREGLNYHSHTPPPSTMTRDPRVAWAAALARSRTWGANLNRMMSTYLISSSCLRIGHFWAQALVESAWAQAVVEGGLGAGHSYVPYYGRGFIQLTLLANYRRYGTYRGFLVTHPNPAPPFAALGWNPDDLIARSDTQYDADSASDTAGFYWLSHHGLHRSDGGWDVATGVSVSRMVNGGLTQADMNDLERRLSNLVHLKFTLGDEPWPTGAHPTESLAFTWRENNDRPIHFTRNGVPQFETRNGVQVPVMVHRPIAWNVAAPIKPQRP